MEIFLQTALSFPTVIYSFLLLLAVFYWIIVSFGLIEIDVLNVEADSTLDSAGQGEGVAALLSKLKLNDVPVSYTHLRAHETPDHPVCRLLLEKKKKKKN